MKKIFLFLLFLLPISVFAKDTCDPSNIKIESITLEDTKGNIEEVKEASSSGQKINLGLRMNVVGDTASYKIILKNNSDEDYVFDEKSLNIDNESIHYEVGYDNESNIIQKGEEKAIYLRVSYKEHIDTSLLNNGIYDDTQIVKLEMTTLKNPSTGNQIILILIGFLIVFFALYKLKKKSAYLLLLVNIIIPLSVRAICTHSLEVETNIVIDAKEATFLPGQEFNKIIKQLSGTQISSTSNPILINNNIITAVRYSDTEPDSINKEDKNIASIPESNYPIYVWFDNGTIYWWSEDKTPCLNENPSYMFSGLLSLTDISGLKTFDLLHSNSLDSLLNYCTSLSNISSLSNWNLSNIESIRGLFNSNSLENLNVISNWNVSNIKNLRATFQGNKLLKDINGLQNWDVTNVENMSYLFNGCNELEDINVLSSWNVKEIKNISYLFSNSGINNITPLKDWDVSKVTNMHWTFFNCFNIEDSSPINDWDITNVTDFTEMFFRVPNNPEFTKRQGTWSGGTFTPTP